MILKDEGFWITVIEVIQNVIFTITNRWDDAVYEIVKNSIDDFILMLKEHW